MTFNKTTFLFVVIASLAPVACGAPATPPKAPSLSKASHEGKDSLLDTQRGQRFVALVDPRATAETASLFASLRELAPNHVLFGHQLSNVLGFSVKKKDGSESDVLQAVGAFPAVYGFDALTISGQGETDYDIDAAMKAVYERGGINTLSAHMFNFVSGGNFWDTSVAVPQILPGGTHHAAYLAYLDKIADFALRLRDKKGKAIPVIFRPFHENTASHFWWGASFCTPHEYKLLFRSTVEYLRDIRQVHNFLYEYSPATHYENEADYLKRYPGDAYVDLLGVDGYDTDQTGDWIRLFVKDAAIAARLAKSRGKVAAIAETGPNSNGLLQSGNPNKNWYSERLLKALLADPDAKQVAYLLVWRNASKTHFWVPYRAHPTLGDHEMLADFQRFYDDPATVFGDRLTGVYSLPVAVRPAGDKVVYFAFPEPGEGIFGEYEVRVKVDGRGAAVSRVDLATADGELPMVLTDGFYRTIWDPSHGELGAGQVLTVTASFEDGKSQSSDVSVLQSEKGVDRVDLSQVSGRISSGGSFAAAGTATATVQQTTFEGAAVVRLDANIVDDADHQNYSYQELRVAFSQVPRALRSGEANLVRFEFMIPDQGKKNFLVSAGLRFYGVTGQPLDFSSEEAWLRDLPLLKVGQQEYRIYRGRVSVEKVAKIARMDLQFITKDAELSALIYLRELHLVKALQRATEDPAVVDTFEEYRDLASDMSEIYVKDAGGNRVELAIDRTGNGNGSAALRFGYSLGTPDYAGVTKRLPNVDWRAFEAIEFWLDPDTKGQNLVIQIKADGVAYEACLPMNEQKRGKIHLPFAAFTRPRWASDRGLRLPQAALKVVTAFSIFINASPDQPVDAFESQIYMDDIRVVGK